MWLLTDKRIISSEFCVRMSEDSLAVKRRRSNFPIYIVDVAYQKH